jgi:hypothetical protein
MELARTMNKQERMGECSSTTKENNTMEGFSMDTRLGMREKQTSEQAKGNVATNQHQTAAHIFCLFCLVRLVADLWFSEKKTNKNLKILMGTFLYVLRARTTQRRQRF